MVSRSAAYQCHLGCAELCGMPILPVLPCLQELQQSWPCPDQWLQPLLLHLVTGTKGCGVWIKWK